MPANDHNHEHEPALTEAEERRVMRTARKINEWARNRPVMYQLFCQVLMEMLPTPPATPGPSSPSPVPRADSEALYDEPIWSDPGFIEAVDLMEAAAQAANDLGPFWPLDEVRPTLAPQQADHDGFTKPVDMDFVFFRPRFRSDGVQRSAKLPMRINVTSLAGLHDEAFRRRRLNGKPQANFIGRVDEIRLLASSKREEENSRNWRVYLVDVNGQHRVTTWLFPADEDPFAFGQACPDIEVGDVLVIVGATINKPWRDRQGFSCNRSAVVFKAASREHGEALLNEVA